MSTKRKKGDYLQGSAVVSRSSGAVRRLLDDGAGSLTRPPIEALVITSSARFDGAETLVARRDANSGDGGAVELGEAAAIDGGAPATAFRVVHRVDAIITAGSVEVRAAGEAIGAFI